MDLDDTALIDVRGRQLEMVLARSRAEIVIGLGAVVLALFASGGALPAPFALGWAALTAVCYGWRFALTEQQRKTPVTESNAGTRARVFTASVVATGTCWGLIAGYALWRDSAAAPALLLLASSACVVAIGAHAGLEQAGLAAAITTWLPGAAALLQEPTRERILQTVALAALTAGAVFTVRSLRRQVWEAAAVRERNRNLTDYLDQRRDQVEKLAVELKTTQGKYEQAEVNLRRTAADLGLVQGKAKALSDTLERISPTCQVTGLANRRQFDQAFEGEWRRAAREHKVVSLCVVGIDDFDEYVATYGRQSADALLKRLATNLRGFARRAGDTPARYQDDKLVLLLPGCDVRNANRMAEAYRKRIEAQAIPHAGARQREFVTLHIGVAMIKPTRAMKPDELLKRVDTALYEAQFQGGNRTVTHQPLSRLRVERWDTGRDGPLNEQSLLQKLLVWGYDTTKLLLRPGTTVDPEIMSEERVVAIASGELRVEVEGHAMVIKPGDCVFVPQGVEMSLEVVGERPVLKYTAAKHA
ncbi:MAG: diguanylate cyclase [Gammaproteobacteria bacterium]